MNGQTSRWKNAVTVSSAHSRTATHSEADAPDAEEELRRLRAENRRLAVSLGAFSAFVASKGLLEEAWNYIHNIHQLEDGAAD